MTLQEEDRGRLVDVPGYGKRIERNFSGSAACHRRQFGLAQLSRDRKSTRLNSSHQIISYAVFCLKKKNFRLRLAWPRDYSSDVRVVLVALFSVATGSCKRVYDFSVFWSLPHKMLFCACFVPPVSP